MSKLSLDQASKIVDSALMEGTRRNLAALCAFVVMKGGRFHPFDEAGLRASRAILSVA